LEARPRRPAFSHGPLDHFASDTAVRSRLKVAPDPADGKSHYRDRAHEKRCGRLARRRAQAAAVKLASSRENKALTAPAKDEAH